MVDGSWFMVDGGELVNGLWFMVDGWGRDAPRRGIKCQAIRLWDCSLKASIDRQIQALYLLYHSAEYCGMALTIPQASE